MIAEGFGVELGLVAECSAVVVVEGQVDRLKQDGELAQPEHALLEQSIQNIPGIPIAPLEQFLDHHQVPTDQGALQVGHDLAAVIELGPTIVGLLLQFLELGGRQHPIKLLQFVLLQVLVLPVQDQLQQGQLLEAVGLVGFGERAVLCRQVQFQVVFYEG